MRFNTETLLAYGNWLLLGSIFYLAGSIGGELLYWAEDDTFGELARLHPSAAVSIDTRYWSVFDGGKAHEVTPFDGKRLSLVYYTVSTWRRAPEMSLRVVEQLGTRLPENR